MSDNNVVGLWFNTTKKPLNDPAVRQAISYAIDRQQLSTDGEIRQRAARHHLQRPAAAGRQVLPGPVAVQRPAHDQRRHEGQLDPDRRRLEEGRRQVDQERAEDHLLDHGPGQLQRLLRGLPAHRQAAQRRRASTPRSRARAARTGRTCWTADLNSGNFTAAIHWGHQGTSPYFFFDNWMDYTLSAPIGKTASADYGRFNYPPAQAALAQYASSGSASVQNAALTKLENIMSTQVPVAPLLLGASWAEYSTRDYTGWPRPATRTWTRGPTSLRCCTPSAAQAGLLRRGNSCRPRRSPAWPVRPGGAAAHCQPAWPSGRAGLLPPTLTGPAGRGCP